MLEEPEVVFGYEHGLDFSVTRQLDALARRRSADDVRQILARKCGCNLLSHAAKVESISAGST